MIRLRAMLWKTPDNCGELNTVAPEYPIRTEFYDAAQHANGTVILAFPPISEALWLISAD